MMGEVSGAVNLMLEPVSLFSPNDVTVMNYGWPTAMSHVDHCQESWESHDYGEIELSPGCISFVTRIYFLMTMMISPNSNTS